MAEKNIAIRVDESLYKRIKVKLAECGLTLKDYITCLIERDLNPEKPINWNAVGADKSVSPKSVAEAQKVLDFVNDVMSGKYSNKK